MDEVDIDRGARDQTYFGAAHQHQSKESLDTRPSQRLHRPRHREIQWHADVVHKQQSSPPQPKIKRQASKGRLLGIFSKAKSTREAKTATEQERNGDHASVSQDGQLPATITRGSSQNDGDGVTPDLVSVEDPVQQPPLMTKRSKSFKKDLSATKPIPWDPPPLFQAYPQSIKHTTAAAPAMSADAILRHQCDKKRRTKKRDISKERRKSDGMNLDEQKSMDDGEDLLQLDQWSPKIYLLVTSGYFLQYAGEGSFDRLPEKIMPIGKDSAAFASDAVPGKHWVLQVSHSLDENGNPKIENPWSFFKKFGIGGDLKRCSASNFLLVLENPTELDSWLSIVRKEIESWGGKRYHRVATAHPGDEEAEMRLQQTSSRRYKVKRDPNQFSNDAQETCNSFGQATTPDATSLPGRKFSTTTQTSVHYSPSTSDETASTDQHNLDRLRNSPHMSTTAKTQSISRETSPNSSPTRPVFQLREFKFSNEPFALDDRMGTSGGQGSTQSCSKKPLEHTLSPTVSRPPSTGRSSRAPSNGAPNFSVPSFSKRYSSAHSTPPLSATSSSGSGNLPRKSMSPPAIDERYDAPPNFTSSMADNGEGVEKEDDFALVDDLDPPVPSTVKQLSATNRTVPRRFSSLEYSRGVSPSNFHPSPSASPHPPPTTALPALPESIDSTTCVPARKLRRPISMQVHTFPSASTSTHSEPLPKMGFPSVDDSMLYLSPPSRPPPPPPPPARDDTSSLHVPSTPGKIHNRRSMPHLGRPPSDPPDYPLPTPPVPKLPPIKLSTGSLRRSVERPLRAGLGRRAPGLVEGNEG